MLTITGFLTVSTLSGQDLATEIKTNAIKIDRVDSLDNSVYKLLKDYQLIMIGEMHGGDEPAKFVIDLTKLLTHNGDSVQVGLEIPSEQMKKYLAERTDSSIYLSEFFTKQPLYGIESFAWAEIISTFTRNKKVKLFFFDANKNDYELSNNRDSLMYLKIKKQIHFKPKWKTITLSGNMHNMVRTVRGINTTAYYLMTDKELNIQDKICSLNHRCKTGARTNNTGNGLELRQVNSPDSDFSTAVDYDSYLFLFPKGMDENYNGIYFTRIVTASNMVNGEIKTKYLSPAIKDSLIKVLSIIDIDDQKYRNQMDYVESQYGRDSKEMIILYRSMKEMDSINLVKVEKIISEYGWLSSDLIGNDGNKTLFMVIQHSDLKTQQKYLPIMRAAVKKGHAKPGHLALLEDRVALLQGEKQIYGSQVTWNKNLNKYCVAPLLDPDNVDKRRKEVGLGPIAEYLLEMEIVWDVEEYKNDLPLIEAEIFKKKN